MRQPVSGCWTKNWSVEACCWKRRTYCGPWSTGRAVPGFLPLRVSARTGKISGEALVSAQKLGRLKQHTQRILAQICGEIARGTIDADPVWRGETRNACQYCEFFQACQFEEHTDRRRWIPSVKNSEFWQWLEQNQEGGNTHGGETNA